MQSKVSQKEENKYHILMHMYGIQKDGADEITCKAAMEKQIQRTDLWGQGGWGEEGQGGLYRQSNMETYITICKIDSQWEFVV